jgi:hypothetical protein
MGLRNLRGSMITILPAPVLLLTSFVANHTPFSNPERYDAFVRRQLLMYIHPIPLVNGAFRIQHVHSEIGVLTVDITYNYVFRFFALYSGL